MGVIFLQGPDITSYVSKAYAIGVSLGSGHPCDQLSAVEKDIRLPVSHDCIKGSSVQLINVTSFLKLSAGQLLGLVDRKLRSIMKRTNNKYLINHVLSVITGKSQTEALMYRLRYRTVNSPRPRYEISP